MKILLPWLCRSLVIALALATSILASSCAGMGHPANLRTEQKHPSSDAIYPSPDEKMHVALNYYVKVPPCWLNLVNSKTDRIMGLAKSSARLSDDNKELLGTIEVAYSADRSTAAVHEEFSDASPAPRYILFRKQRGSSDYAVDYFAPPSEPTHQKEEWAFRTPKISRISNRSITLLYDDAMHKTRTLKIADLLISHEPRSWNQWPDRDFDRYKTLPGS